MDVVCLLLICCFVKASLSVSLLTISLTTDLNILTIYYGAISHNLSAICIPLAPSLLICATIATH